MPNHARRQRLTGRAAHWIGTLWLTMLATQVWIAFHDTFNYPEEAVNYQNVRPSVLTSFGFLVAIGVLNTWAWLMRKYWRREPPPYIDWLVRYNVRVAVAWGLTQIAFFLVVKLDSLPGHLWAVTHLSAGYAWGSIGALAGLPLLLTRRWHQDQSTKPESATESRPDQPGDALLERESADAPVAAAEPAPAEAPEIVEIELPDAAEAVETVAEDSPPDSPELRES